jgi:dsRNA-specific ribonuclease
MTNKLENSIVDDDNQSINNENNVLLKEQLFFDPYNSLNKEITINELYNILKAYGVDYKINNFNLFKRAFVHRSYTKKPTAENSISNITILEKPDDCMKLSTKSNERLEFLGDGVLELITKYYLYRRFPKADEGFMTEKKIALVKNEHIGKLAYELRLHKWLIISKNAEEKKVRTNLKKLGCLFEAFIGALFLDCNKISISDSDEWFKNLFVTGPGLQMVQIFVENIFEKHVNWTKLISTDDNYKNILQVKIQKTFKTTPHYIEIEKSKEFGYKMGVYICVGKEIHYVNNNSSKNINEYNSLDEIQEELNTNTFIFIFLAESTHKIKKKAEQTACEKAIYIINRLI